MAAKAPQTARLLQVLLWYDGPQIVLLQPQPQQFLLGVAVEVEGMHSPFIAAHVSIRQLVDYQMERVDLRYLFTNPDLRKWWLLDLDNEADQIPIMRLKATDSRIDDNAPESGFFARDHEEIANLNVQVANSTQTFDIDGAWDLGEFSQFYGQIEDVYYLFHSVGEYNKVRTSPARKKQIETALLRPFRGGGSYRGMYSDFANDNDRAAKLRVSGIKYHSPGYVEVKALRRPFEQSIKLLRKFASDKAAIKQSYRNLHGTLSKNNLLKKESRIFGNDLRQVIKDQSYELASKLPGISMDDFLRIAGNDLLVASKVLLSVVRRVDKLFQFFDEGRAKHPEIVLK